MKQYYYEHEKCLFFCPYPMLEHKMSYVDILENEKDEFPYLLKIMRDLEDVVFEWKIEDYGIFGKACVVTLTIRNRDYEKILNFVKNLPAKVRYFCSWEVYKKYVSVVSKVYDILKD